MSKADLMQPSPNASPEQRAMRGDLRAASLRGLPPLVLHAGQRSLLGLQMAPLLSGEFALLAFLGARPCAWNSTERLSICVYRRDDSAARQLVWKYISTLRKKLAPVAPGLIEVCRRRGYSCRAEVVVVSGADDDLELSSPGSPRAKSLEG